MELTAFLTFLKEQEVKPVVFEGLADASFKLHNASLKQIGLATIPDELKMLYTATDGMIIKDIEMFGLIEHERPKRFYTLPSLADFNLLFKDHIFMVGKLILAAKSYYLFIYDVVAKKFIICDRVSFEPFSQFDDVYEGLRELVGYTA